ncbi:MAG: ankyrin repeat domain-containing protein, partial [Pseudomonadota bacterium]
MAKYHIVLAKNPTYWQFELEKKMKIFDKALIASGRSTETSSAVFHTELNNLFNEPELIKILHQFHNFALNEAEQSEINDILNILVDAFSQGVQSITNLIFQAISLGGMTVELLNQAVIYNRLDMLRPAIATGFNFNSVDEVTKNTPLTNAVHSMNINTVKFLIEECGADANYNGGEKNGSVWYTPLSTAAFRIHYVIDGVDDAVIVELYAIIKYLLLKGAVAEFDPAWKFCDPMPQEQFDAIIDRARLELSAELEAANLLEVEAALITNERKELGPIGKTINDEIVSDYIKEGRIDDAVRMIKNCGGSIALAVSDALENSGDFSFIQALVAAGVNPITNLEDVSIKTEVGRQMLNGGAAAATSSSSEALELDPEDYVASGAAGGHDKPMGDSIDSDS